MVDDLAKRVDELEALVWEQRETIATQCDRIDDLEARIEDTDAAPADGHGGPAAGAAETTRRSALTAGGLLGLLGLGAGFGAGNVAAQSSPTPEGQIGTSGRPVEALFTAELNGPVTGTTPVRSLSGVGLAVDGANGELTIADDGVDADHVADDAVDTDAIAPDAVDHDAIVDDAVDRHAIAATAVDRHAIADSAVDAGAIADGAVDTDAIADGAVTTRKVTDEVSGIEVDGDTVTRLAGSSQMSVQRSGDTAAIVLDPQPWFDVSIDDITYTDYGPTVYVTAVEFTVTNEGLVGETQAADVVIGHPDSIYSRSEDVTLGPLESTSLTIATDPYPTAAQTVTLSTDDDSDSETVES